MITTATSLLSVTSTTAQLSPDNPARITSNEIVNSWNLGKVSSYFYTFTASPGELNIILETLGNRGAGVIDVKLLNKNWEEIGVVSQLVDNQKLERIGNTFEITQPQELIIKIDMENYFYHV